MTRLSIIIPGYNTPEEWWCRCLKAVCTSCGSDDEIICVDDGSKDRPEFLNDIAKEDSRVKPIFISENVGQAAARNIALDKAKGEWVAFVDSDDEITADIYNKCFAVASKECCDIVLFGVRVIWNEEHLYKDDIPQSFNPQALDGNRLQSLFSGCLFEYPVNRIYRKSFLDRNGIRFDAGFCPGEDTIFNLKCVLHDAAFCAIPKIGYVYYRNFSSSLARYQKNFDASLAYRNALWNQVCAKVCATEGSCPKLGRLTKSELAYWSIQNAWRFDSPLPLSLRWRWMQDNRGLLPSHPIVMFLKQLVASYIRRYLYIKPVRRWKIKRMFPNAKEMR